MGPRFLAFHRPRRAGGPRFLARARAIFSRNHMNVRPISVEGSRSTRRCRGGQRQTACLRLRRCSAQSPPLKLRVGSAAAQLRQTVCTARVDGTTPAVWLREPSGCPDGSQRQTDFTASPACALTHCCTAAQRAAMGSLPIAHTLLSVLGTW